MKILYKPFGIIAGLIGARIATATFKALMAGIGAVVERAGARAFHHLTGIWPGDKHPEE